MHLAAASGVPTIGLFSVTDPVRYEPYGGLSRSILTTGHEVHEIAAFVVPILRGTAAPMADESFQRATVSANKTDH